MNEPITILIGIILLAAAIRLFLKPLKLLLRLICNSVAGIAVLLAFHFLEAWTGVAVGINLFSVLLTALLGLPGAALLLLLGKIFVIKNSFYKHLFL